MTISELKEYIYQNNKIEYVLQEIGCHDIHYHFNKEYYSCANYNGDNVNAINIKNNKHLNVTNWTRTKEFPEGSDIVTLIQYNKNLSFVDAVKYLHKILGFKYSYKKQSEKKSEIFDPLGIFKKIQQAKKKTNVDDIHVLDEDLLNDYVPVLHIDWLRNGIMPWTREKFKLAYSYKRKRVIIPMRHWATGELLGINSRTTVQNYDEFGIKKYYLSSTYPKNLNLYGLYENYEDIQKAGYVVIYEAEKSVLKRDSLNDPTGIALSGHSISNEQARILIGLNVEIIVALDKDIPIEEIRHICESFYNIRNVSYIYDKWDLLGEKDSPADASNKIYQFLFKHRVKYDENEHNQYLKSLNKK